MCTGPTSLSFCGFVRDVPVDRKRVVAAHLCRRHAQHAEAVTAGELAAGRRHGGCHRDLRMRPGIGAKLARRIDEIEPVRFLRDALACEQLQDHLDAFDHAVALRRRIDAHGECVGGKQPRAHAEHHPPARLVIELDDAVRRHQRRVIGQRNDAGSEHDALRPLRGGGDEHFRARDDLVAGGMMLADPGFLVAQPVEMLDQLEVALDAERRVLVDGMEWREEYAVAQLDGHGRSLRNGVPAL
jgi:hypothetical protein